MTLTEFLKPDTKKVTWSIVLAYPVFLYISSMFVTICSLCTIEAARLNPDRCGCQEALFPGGLWAAATAAFILSYLFISLSFYLIKKYNRPIS